MMRYNAPLNPLSLNRISSGFHRYSLHSVKLTTFLMITDLKEIENSALNLNKRDKARLADKLLQSIHGKIDPEIEQAWIDEVEKVLDVIEQQPASGTKITNTERRFLVSRFP